MFEPPRCPYRHCAYHTNVPDQFFQHYGSYKPKCRSRPVPRFRCNNCERTFSRQTFRADYCDHKPHLNAQLLELIISGVGLRQSARILGMSLTATELKFRKICRHLRRVNVNMRSLFPEGSIFQLDEIESYEEKRRERPLTFPILIETLSLFIIWGESATLAPKGRMSEQRRKDLEKENALRGPRKSNSKTAIRRTLERGFKMAGELSQWVIQTDEKTTYPGLIRDVFVDLSEPKLVIHETTNSKVVRDTKNPLFPINHTEAKARDLLGRLRRKSWLGSKKRRYLDLAFQALMAWHNFVRSRTNHEDFTPAQAAGLVGRRFKIGELLGWRQDWYERSPAVGSRCTA